MLKTRRAAREERGVTLWSGIQTVDLATERGQIRDCHPRATQVDNCATNRRAPGGPSKNKRLAGSGMNSCKMFVSPSCCLLYPDVQSRPYRSRLLPETGGFQRCPEDQRPTPLLQAQSRRIAVHAAVLRAGRTDSEPVSVRTASAGTSVHNGDRARRIHFVPQQDDKPEEPVYELGVGELGRPHGYN